MKSPPKLKGEKWVVNASPVIALGRVGQAGLLLHLPQEVIIPKAVAEEILLGQEMIRLVRWWKVAFSGFWKRRLPRLKSLPGTWAREKQRYCPLRLQIPAGQPSWMTVQRDAVREVFLFP